MPTMNQLVRRGRKKKTFNGRRFLAMEGAPQARGTVTRVFYQKDGFVRKPVSGNRAIVQVRLANGHEVLAYLPGHGSISRIQEHSVVLIRPGKKKDCSAVNYRVILGGKFDANEARDARRQDGNGVPNRTQKRSKYGWKKP